MTVQPAHPIIELGMIPIVVHDDASAKRAGQMVEEMAIAALEARRREVKQTRQGAAE